MSVRNLLSRKSFEVPGYLAPSAWLEHIPFAFWLVEKQKPKMIVELGVYYGVSYFALCQAVKNDNLSTICYGVDNWIGDKHAGFYDESVFQKVSKHNADNYGSFSYLIRDDFSKAVEKFEDCSIDLLHIDGLHLYEAVKHDFEQWLPKLSKSSVVLFHDIYVREKDFGVYRLWNELSKKFPSFSFTHGYGLGVLSTGSSVPAGISELFKAKGDDLKDIRAYYHRLGGGISDRLAITEQGEKIRDLVTQAEQQKKEKEEIEKKLNDQNSRIHGFSEEFERLQGKADSYVRKIADFEQEIITYHQIEEKHEREVQGYKRQIVELKDENDTQHLEIESVKIKNSIRGEELEAANSRIEKLKEELVLSLLDHSSVVKGLKDKILSLEGRISELLDEYIKKHEQTNKLIERLQARDIEKNDEIISLAVLNENNRKQFESDIESAERRYSALKEDHDRAMSLVKDLEDLLSKEKSEREKLIKISNASFWKKNNSVRMGKKAITTLSAKSHFAIKGVKSIFNGTFQSNYEKWKKIKRFPNVPHWLIDDYELLTRHNLFNADWYLLQYADVKEDNADPILHYLIHGYKEGRDPSQYFSTNQYYHYNSDVKEAGVNPLIHYIRHGLSEGRRYEASREKIRIRTDKTHTKAVVQTVEPALTHESVRKKIVISPSAFKYGRNGRDYDLVKNSGLFDEEWYLQENPEVPENNIDPIEHYLNMGWLENKNPNPLFNTSWYLNTYSDVRQSNGNPFLHFIARGDAEHRDPHPLFRLNYIFQYNPDLAIKGTNPLKHFLSQGYKENRTIHPLFDQSFYQKETGLDPRQVNLLLHYLKTGWKQKINPNPFFDVAYYLNNLPDKREEPLTHFVQQEIEQKSDPSPFFNTDFYLQTNPDIHGRFVSDPLIHFLSKGVSLLRRPSLFFKIYEFREGGGLNNISSSSDLERYLYNGALDPVYEYLETKARINESEKRRLQSYKPRKGDLLELGDDKIKTAVGQIKFKKNADPKVSIIIPYYKAKKYIVECLLSLTKWTDPDLIEVLVINDRSPDDIRPLLENVPNLVYNENEKNSGFVRSCNKGARIAKGKYLLFLNNDTQVIKDSIENLAIALDRNPSWGIVGPKVLYPSGHLQEAGCKINSDGTSDLIGLNDDPDLKRYNYSREVDYVSGCSLMIRKEVFEKLDGFSLEFEPSYCEDSDLCMKARTIGYRAGYVHDSVIYHHLGGGASDYKNFHIANNQGKFFKKWFREIQELNDVRIIPFYFPQFHLYNENEFWWGKGFTEWTSVTKSLPNFEGHVQPKLPTDQGFYDIRLPDAMEHQKKLAGKYEVSGFCFYYYWFAGKRIMEFPLEKILKEDKPDFPFCICWANENFTRRWDGGNNEIMLGQDHSDEDDEAVIKDMLRYARHKNYIRINEKPLIFLYRHSLFPDIRRTVDTWRKIAEEVGVGEIYLGFVESFQHAYLMDDPKEYGFDISVQFPPHQNAAQIPPPGKILNPDFGGNIHDYREMVLNYTNKPVPGFKRFPGTMPGWDNTPRQKNKPNIFAFANPGSFRAWLEWNIKISCEQNPPGERFVFVNAWNEWAEGTFLEPSREDGHGYLESIRNAKQSWLR